MATRLFNTEHKPGGITEKWYSDERGHISRTLQQDATQIVKAVEAASYFPGKDMKLLTSVPVVLAHQWSLKIGHAVGSPEWLEYAIKKTQSSEYQSLSTGIKI